MRELTSQQAADQSLYVWQQLRAAGLTPEQRMEALMASFFQPPAPSDVEYSATERDQMEIWANG